MNSLAGQLEDLPTAAEPVAAPALPDALLGIQLSVQVVIGSVRLPLSRIAALGPGAVIALDQRLGEPVTLVVNGKDVAKGELFVSDSGEGRLGVRITSITGGATP